MQGNALIDIVGAVRSAAALTEASFLPVGTLLQEAAQVLGTQAAAFETLLQELDAAALKQAFDRLAWSAGQVTQVGTAQDEARGHAAALLHALDAVAGRITRMIASVGQAAPLAINAKILAAQLSAGAVDFSSFADEITRTLRMTRDSLTGFQAELQAVRDRVARSPALREAGARRGFGATTAIAARLTDAVAAAARQHERAGRASLALQQQNGSIRSAVGEAVGALQIGDTTRQRLEHVAFGLGLLDPLPPDEAAAVGATLCRLQAAQLEGSAEQFEQATASIAAALHKLAEDARGLRALGATAFAGRGGGNEALYSATLETQVAEALGLFETFRAAREETVQLVAAVSESTARLCRELRTVQALEADIRIMGLNAALKCGRIGEQGRALRLIAQELCRYVDQFAGQAQTLITAVEQAAGIADTLTSTSAAASSTTTEVESAMQDALATLREKGRRLGAALVQFEANGERVGALLEQAVTNTATHAGIGAAMRAAADALVPMSVAPAEPVAAAAPLLERIERSYTMAAERVIHDRMLGRAMPPPPAAPEAELSLEDMLF